MATGAFLTRKIISRHVYSSVRLIQSFQGLGHGYSSSAYSSLGYYQHSIKERDENLVTKPYEFTVIGGDKVRSEMFLTMGMRFRSLSIHSASAATANKPESVKDDEEKEIMAAKRRKEASPEECERAVEGLRSVKAKAKAKHFADSQKVAKSILQRARTIIVGIGLAIRAIASMSSIKHDDRLIQSVGVKSRSEAELHEDCRKRSMLQLHSVEDMRKQLHNWLDLSLNYSVPSSLLILSRAFTVSGTLKPEEAVQATLSSLPDEVVDTVSITSLPSEDPVSGRRRKLEYIEMQEELIKEEEELSRMKESEISEDVALKEMFTLTAGEAQELARERMLEKQEELCEVSRALPVFASASSVSTKCEEFSRLVNKKIDLYKGMALQRARTVSPVLFGRFLQYPPISLSIVHSSNAYRQFSTGTVADNQTLLENMKRELLHLDVTSQIGSCMPLAAMRIGTMIHNIEVNPGQGGKLVRSAGTCAKILKEPTSKYCLVKLPSGDEKWIDSRCRATVGTVSNPSHGARKLRKAGQSRWLGRRPVVRGVAMNPIDHPHGGGEGKSKSSGNHGRCSMTPWGKPCKGGYKTARPKRKKSGPPMRS